MIPSNYLNGNRMVSYMDFKIRLAELRDNADLKQTELAEKVSLKSSAISKYEKGLTQPSMDTLIRFAEIFNVSVDYLLGLSSIPNPYTTENFTPKEVDIILRFRRLTKVNQIRIDERINTMLDNQNK